jgi:hypothetical protein
MEKSNCLFMTNHVHYKINEQKICIPKDIPLSVIENYRVMIEIFGFNSCAMSDDYCPDTNELQYYTEDNYLIFYVFKNNYIIKDEMCDLLVKSDNFDDIINYIDSIYPNIRITPYQKPINIE